MFKTIFILGILSGMVMGFAAKKPALQPIIIPAVPIVVPPSSNTPIIDIVSQSKCAQYQWKNRGKPGIGYIKGTAQMYAKAVCSSKEIPYTGSNDALKKYEIDPTLLNTYTLLIGLGMRESSGKYCEGRDASAGNTASDTAEAGLFQTSYNAKAFIPEMDALMAKYKTGNNCLLDVFKEGQSACSTQNLRTYGSGDGATFQQLSKSCPAFAVEVASLGIRYNYRHWGPLARQEAEMNQDCKAMLIQVGIEGKKACP